MSDERRNYVLQQLQGVPPERWQTRDQLIPEGHWADYPYSAVGAVLRELRHEGVVESRDDVAPGGRRQYRLVT